MAKTKSSVRGVPEKKIVVVKPYKKSDGTKVDGYIRNCYKHSSLSEQERLAGQAKYKDKKFQDIPQDELEQAISFFI